MMRCPCGYMEVRADKPVLWWCQLCRRGECQVCNQLLPEGTSTSAEDLDVQLRPHVVGCAGLREAKRLVDEALEKGQKTMACPNCSLAGRKDEACTHMSCPRCQSSWCYLCGLSVQESATRSSPGRAGQRRISSCTMRAGR
ncbi:unnamed protein product [Effrenium voratum]|nr:unnamed protein product [Effrenium voratum]